MDAERPSPPSAEQRPYPQPSTSRRALAVLLAVSFAGGAGLGAVWSDLEGSSLPSASALSPPGVRSYDLEIRAADIEVGPGTVWHAWTFNGTVPGPALAVVAGETLRVTVTNKHTLAHSFHTHLAPYGLAFDGSQLNGITGIGAAAMIEPGAAYTYEFRPTAPGIYYYHCHSAGGGHMISEHIAQGLYGAIVVKAPDEAPVREEALFMAERGFDIDGDQAPFYVMNGMGHPGGEHHLEEIFAVGGIDAVKGEFGKTLPIVVARVNEPLRLAIVNIGDQPHTFHLHGFNHQSVDQYPGRNHPANVVQLLPGGADRILLMPTQPGVWLFHCHVVSHADMGMIGVFVVEGG